MIWKYYNLFAYDKQAVFADEYFIDNAIFKLFICENLFAKYLRFPINFSSGGISTQ